MGPRIKRTYHTYNPESDILNYEFTYNYDETRELRRRLNRNSEIDICDLRRIALWKIDRVLDIDDETIALLRELAESEDLTIESDPTKVAIDRLVNSQGVGFPMASAILKFIRPDIFPIIDVRAYRVATGTKPYYSTYTYDKYVEYTKKLMQWAEEVGRPLSEMDEQLYCLDESENGKI